jgi:single-strand DNA-binding protein
MINKVVLMGRLVRDPEIKYTANNIAVCSFTVAVDRRFVRHGEEKQADFIQVVAWRNTAEFVSKYFTKGKMIALAGSIQTRTWDDQEGKKHYATEVVADEISFTGEKTTQNGTNGGVSGTDEYGFIPVESDDDLPFK